MSRIDKFAAPLLASMLMLVLGSFSPAAVAAKVEFKINQNKQCIMCHKRNGKMFGLHANDALDLTCQNCHGEKAGHPRKASELIGFGAKSVAKSDVQTAACLQCHDVETLSQADWTHDVHSNKVNCASCHQLHPEIDPIIGVTALDRSEMCSGCHSAK
ncbi:nitrite reductase [Shewanella canadensis]|uniref:Nitrite reductase n=1 Tax=Shewanella canadensis TaxID=271096 RepID=A0A431WRE8_9GAMM|nr:multiheme c-type cytochrome [Shewanella canadensis]RTR38126.1 nitrite reductase [Shewanella canadensis]